jgi:amidase
VLAIADALDAERRAGKVRGTLHGIPILIKDNIDTADRMQTTSGSLALEGHIATKDAFIVKQLRKAGALILGKTNLSEWANFRGKRSVSGWSSRGGLTRNPYALDRTACGSSSGSGAAVAANLCAGAVGTETDGSIICPAQTNGIVGIKPTLGLLSRSGIIPIAHSQDTAGPMARTVTDAAVLLGAMAGVDGQDLATKGSKKRGGSGYTRILDRDGLREARIGVARNMAGTNPRVLKIFEHCIEVLKHLGAIIIDPADVPNFDKYGKSELEVLHYEFKADLNKYLRTVDGTCQVHSMADVIKFNQENSHKVMPYFGQEHMLTAQETKSLRDKKYRAALARNLRLTRKEGIDAALRKHKLDAIIVPSGGPAWLIDLVDGDSSNWDMESTAPAAVAGYPHITVPAGFVFGLPVGLSFFAGAWQEPTLIRFAYAFEQATQYRRQPRYLPTANLNP